MVTLTEEAPVTGFNNTCQNSTDIPVDHSSNLGPVKEALIIIEAIIIVPIVGGNLLIIVSLAKFRRLRDRMNLLVGNLAIGDLLTGIVVIPYDMAFLLNENLAKNQFTCLLRLVLLFSSLMLTLLNLLVISIERYIAIVHPFVYSSHFTGEKFFQTIVVIWTFTITSTVFPLFGQNTWRPRVMCSMTHVWTSSYTIFISSFSMFVILLNVFLFLRVLQVSWVQIEATAGTLESRQTRNGNILRAKLMGFVFVIFTLFWGPFFLLMGVRASFGSLESNTDIRIAMRLFFGLGLANSGVNWVIYGIKNRDFRNAFRQLLYKRHNRVRK